MSAGAVVAIAAIAQAIRASGVLVRVSPEDFQKILRKAEQPLVIQAKSSSFFSLRNQYLTSYKGFAFFTKSAIEIVLPAETETILAKKIWIP